MADLVITPANVVRNANARQPTYGYRGETINAGQTVVKHPTTGLWMLADSNHATAGLRAPDGIALNSGGVNQPIAVHEGGRITIGAATVVGAAYVQSDNPGGICPIADLGTGETATFIGWGVSVTEIEVDINKSGVQVP